MRREEIIELTDRGNTLKFKIKEMPATRLESWIYRALLVLAGSGITTPDGSNIEEAATYLKVKGLGAIGGIDYEKAKPLLDELLQCCTRVLPDGVETQVDPNTADGYIEDVRTLFKLRLEAGKFNLSFFNIDDLSKSPLLQGKNKVVDS